MPQNIVFSPMSDELAAKAREIAEKYVRPLSAKFDKAQEYNWEAARAVAHSGIFKTIAQMKGTTVTRESKMAPHLNSDGATLYLGWTESLPGDTNDRLRNEWLSVVLAAFGLPLIILFFARRQVRRWGGAPSS